MAVAHTPPEAPAPTLSKPSLCEPNTFTSASLSAHPNILRNLLCGILTADDVEVLSKEGRPMHASPLPQSRNPRWILVPLRHHDVHGQHDSLAGYFVFLCHHKWAEMEWAKWEQWEKRASMPGIPKLWPYRRDDFGRHFANVSLHGCRQFETSLTPSEFAQCLAKFVYGDLLSSGFSVSPALFLSLPDHARLSKIAVFPPIPFASDDIADQSLPSPVDAAKYLTHDHFISMVTYFTCHTSFAIAASTPYGFFISPVRCGEGTTQVNGYVIFRRQQVDATLASGRRNVDPGSAAYACRTLVSANTRERSPQHQFQFHGLVGLAAISDRDRFELVDQVEHLLCRLGVYVARNGVIVDHLPLPPTISDPPRLFYTVSHPFKLSSEDQELLQDNQQSQVRLAWIVSKDRPEELYVLPVKATPPLSESLRVVAIFHNAKLAGCLLFKLPRAQSAIIKVACSHSYGAAPDTNQPTVLEHALQAAGSLFVQFGWTGCFMCQDPVRHSKQAWSRDLGKGWHRYQGLHGQWSA